MIELFIFYIRLNLNCWTKMKVWTAFFSQLFWLWISFSWILLHDFPFCTWKISFLLPYWRIYLCGTLGFQKYFPMKAAGNFISDLNLLWSFHVWNFYWPRILKTVAISSSLFEVNWEEISNDKDYIILIYCFNNLGLSILY